MPANLTLQYLQAEERFKAAQTHDDKVAALEEMIRELPKHKHTEKMFADLKTRLSKLKKEGETKKGPAVGHKGTEYVVKKEGVGQVVVLGAPNTGKSAILAAVTHAHVEVTDYPFTTRKVIPGMMDFEDVVVQLCDTPSISPDFQDPFLMPFVRTADAAVLVVDLSSPDCLDQPGWVLAALEEARIELARGTVTGQAPRTTPRLPAFVAATHADHPDAPDALELLAEVLGDRLPVVPVDTADPESMKRFARACFDLFGVVRVYSKQPGKDADRDAPFLVPVGANVVDFAERVHRDFRDRFSFARVWGPGLFEGQRVPRDYAVQDGDVVELHLV